MRRNKVVSLSAVVLSACTLQRWQPASTSSPDDHMSHMSAVDLRAPMRDMGSTRTDWQGTPGLPASNSSAAARLAASPRHAEWVKIAWEPGSKDSLMAWVVYPAARTKAPVVVVVHEIFGLSTWVRGVADQVAAEGFIAVAPDFLSRARGGPTTTELTGDSANKLIQGYSSSDKNLVIVAAANYGMTLPSADHKYAVIGYCWGGTATFNHAIHGGLMGFSGGVAFYGLPYTSGGGRATATTPATPAVPIADSLAKIKVPVMLLSGSRDARIGAAMPALDSMMKALGKSYSGTNYEGAIHGFLRAQDDPATGANADAGPANLAATKDGWPKTVAFLKKNLGVK
jgi:carboxymethylenebutenolidase